MSNKKQRAKVDPVEVYCRIRPLSDSDADKCLRVLDDTSLLLQVPDSSSSYRSGHTKQLIYSFTHIMDESTTQRQVFDMAAQSLVQEALHGKHGLLFTYGVTGSGKTHTMMGSQSQPHGAGLLQRSLDALFTSVGTQQAPKSLFRPDRSNSFDVIVSASTNDLDLIDKQKRQVLAQIKSISLSNKSEAATKLETRAGQLYGIFVSCVEIYNNYIYDLLEADSGQNRESKALKEDAKGCMFIKDVAEIEVRSTDEALELMQRAQKRRVVAYTDLNAESSRSHSIFTIRLVQIPEAAVTCGDERVAKGAVHVSQLSLVDLAGSERTKRTKNTGSRLKEAGNINSSLMALRNCMEVLRDNLMNGTRKMVPYRDSKLTMLFKNFFEGSGRIKMILCVNPNANEFDETVNVLKFSELVKDVLVPGAQEMKVAQVMSMKPGAGAGDLGTAASLWDAFPPLDLFSPDDEVTLRKLIDFLEEANKRRDAVIVEASALNQQLFARLKAIGDENDRLRDENAELKRRLEYREKNEKQMDVKIKSLERVVNSNMRTPGGVVGGLKENVRPGSELDLSVVEKKRNREPVEALLSVPNTPVATFRSSRLMATSQSAVKGQSGGMVPHLPPLHTPASAVSGSATSRVAQAILAHNARYRSPMVPHTPGNGTGGVSGLRDGVPVANRRQQRRSKSAETWLDHQPGTIIKTDTVMQPKMTKKKSVSKLELADAKKSSKYVLTHQQQDDEGEIVTNLIKGDILQSPSGGANIVFTDIETLNIKPHEFQMYKQTRKRASEELNIEDRQSIQDRCSIAIESHGSARKTVKRSKN